MLETRKSQMTGVIGTVLILLGGIAVHDAVAMDYFVDLHASGWLQDINGLSYLPEAATGNLTQTSVSATNAAENTNSFASYNVTAGLEALSVNFTTTASQPGPFPDISMANVQAAVRSYDTFTTIGPGLAGVDSVQYKLNYSLQGTMTNPYLVTETPAMDASIDITTGTSSFSFGMSLHLDRTLTSTQTLSRSIQFSALTGSQFSLLSELTGGQLHWWNSRS